MPAPIIDEEERQEIRIALVMTGGVSLAVWMGGVAAELHRAIRRESVYRDVLDLTRSAVLVDVIGGTSAGGVNGGLLAAALASGTELGALRDVWLEVGSLLAMFRSDAERYPPSLLKGDDYFLTHLRRVFTDLTNSPGGPSEQPMHLVMTTTLMRGQHRVYQDRYGGRINDLSHRGTFSFIRDDERDDFAEAGVADRLALAARSTASFPGAFEPSRIPIGAGSGSKDAAHPDMAAHADFGAGGYVIDGGVLANKPIRPVLRVLYTRQTEGQGRRVLAYVIPDPGLSGKVAPADAGMPRMSSVIASSMHIPRVESVVEDLDSIRNHNQQVVAQRRLREAMLGTGDAARVDPISLAAQLFPAYVGARRDYTLRSILEAVDRAVRASGAPGWDRTAARRALVTALEPSLPEGLPAPADVSTWAWDVAGVKGALGVLSQLLSIGLEVTSAADRPQGTREALRADRLEVREARRALQRLRLVEERHWLGVDVQPLRDAASVPHAQRDEFLQGWAAAALDGSLAASPGPELKALARRAGEILTAALVPLRQAAGLERPGDAVAQGSAQGSSGDGARARTAGSGIGAMIDGLSDSDGAVEPNLQWLLATVVSQAAFAGSEPVVEQIIELMQISADAANGFDQRDTAVEKLAGLQLGHFGAFYKRSWRANDWMWGRLDAVPNLLHMLLDPARLRRLAANDPAFASSLEARVVAMALGDDADGTRAALEPLLDREAIARELAAVIDPANPVPDSLPACRLALTRRTQLRILQEELPHTAAAMRYDLADGATPHPEALAFLDAFAATQTAGVAGPEGGTRPQAPRRRITGRSVPAPPGSDVDTPLHPADALRLFPLCRVGAERIETESDSALYKRTAGAATAVGLRAARRRVPTTGQSVGRKEPAMATLPVLMPLVRGIAVGSQAVFMSVIVLLAAGAVLLAFALGSGGTHWVPAVIGAILVLLGLGLALLRIQSLLIAGVVVLAAASMLVLSFVARHGSVVASGWFRASALLVLVVGLIVLARRERSREQAATE